MTRRPPRSTLFPSTTLFRSGRAREALDLLDDALGRVERTGERFTEPELHRLRAEALLAQSPPAPDQAWAAYRTAIEVARRYAAAPAERRATEGLRRMSRTAPGHSSRRSRVPAPSTS